MSDSGFILIKGLLSKFNLIMDDWDEPQERIDENGRTIKGRPSIGFGDKNEFTYAGKTLKARPWTDAMKGIRNECQRALKEYADTEKKITFLLAGYYPEEKGIPMHSDAVPTLDDWVVSCSFGGSRVFGWEEYNKDIKTESYTSHTPFILRKDREVCCRHLLLLEHGDVVMFNGASQMKTRHNVPDLQGISPRTNLTFRTGL